MFKKIKKSGQIMVKNDDLTGTGTDEPVILVTASQTQFKRRQTSNLLASTSIVNRHEEITA